MFLLVVSCPFSSLTYFSILILVREACLYSPFTQLFTQSQEVQKLHTQKQLILGTWKGKGKGKGANSFQFDSDKNFKTSLSPLFEENATTGHYKIDSNLALTLIPENGCSKIFERTKEKSRMKNHQYYLDNNSLIIGGKSFNRTTK